MRTNSQIAKTLRLMQKEYNSELKKQWNISDLGDRMADFYFKWEVKILWTIDKLKRKLSEKNFQKILRAARRHIVKHHTFNYVPKASIVNLFRV